MMIWRWDGPNLSQARNEHTSRSVWVEVLIGPLYQNHSGVPTNTLKRWTHTTQHKLFAFFFIFLKLFFLYLRFFPFFLAIPAFGTTYLGWHVRLFLKQTSIQSLHLVASKVWIQLIKIKVYIFPPYFTHKIKTLFWTPSKMGVLKYLTFVSQINVMRQKIKHKNCTKMIKFILKIPVIKWCKEYINLILFYVTDHQSN